MPPRQTGAASTGPALSAGPSVRALPDPMGVTLMLHQHQHQHQHERDWDAAGDDGEFRMDLAGFLAGCPPLDSLGPHRLSAAAGSAAMARYRTGDLVLDA